MSLAGLWVLLSGRQKLKEVFVHLSKHPFFWAFALYVSVNSILTWHHGDPASNFGNALPFIIFPLAIFTFLSCDVSFRGFWLGAATGAIVAFVISSYQIYGLGMERAIGFRNPILFGNTAVVLGTAALIGWVSCRSAFRDFELQALLVAGGLSGLFASLLSGSKGGWLSLLMVAALVTSKAIKAYHWIKKLLAITFVLSILTVIVFFGPKLVVIDRIVSAYHGTVTWMKTGQVTEYSASSRFESFKAGLLVGSQSPLVGLGVNGQFEAIQKAIDEGKINPKFLDYRVIDNDFISLFSTKGLLGVAAGLAVHLGIFLTFFRHRNDSLESVRALATMGMLLVVLYLEFGLSVSIFGTNIFRIVYISWAMILLGLILVEKRNAESSAGVNFLPY